MPTYIILAQLTQKGIDNIKDSPKRLAAFGELVDSLGGKLIAGYYTMGQYDVVVIFKAPSNEVAMKATLTTGSLGNVKTETLVAVPSEKAAEIIKELPE